MHYVLKEEEMSGKANKVKRISLLAFQQKQSVDKGLAASDTG